MVGLYGSLSYRSRLVSTAHETAPFHAGAVRLKYSWGLTSTCCMYKYVRRGGCREWTWSPEKDARNRKKHGLPLSIGEVALADPLALSQPDPHPDGDRWNTVAVVHGRTLFIVHT